VGSFTFGGLLADVAEKGLIGRGGGKDSHVEEARNHQSAPLSSLKDPSTFAPPPRRLDYNADPTASRPPPTATPAGSAKQRLQEREEARRREEEKANRPPPGPYQPDTTGLSTAHLPTPPAFRPTAVSTPPSTNAASKPKPSLPPRLPPRQNSNPNEFAPAPPPTYNEATQETPGMINQGAMSRLGQAGITVPGFGIDRTASPPVPARHNPSPPIPPRQKPSSARTPIAPPPPASRGPQLGELQNRFAKMSTGSSAEETAPSTGTSWADKQAALRTASSLREDPSKVTANDLKGAASTANNFQQRHGAQVASGFKAANGLNQKYGLAGRVSNFASSGTSSAPTQPTPPQSPVQSGQGGFGKKLAPPPPPKKKELGGSSGEPPPIPLSSKPKF
jgi:hypothetical protein